MFRSERFRRLSKEGFWIVLGQVLAVIGSLVSVRLLTEILSPSAYGELALGMTIATLVNQAILGPLGGGIARYYAPAVEYGDLSGYLNSARKLVLYATGIIIFITVFTVSVLTVADQIKWVVITIIAIFFAVISGGNAILSGIQTAARQRAIVALHQGVEPWLRSLVAAGLLLLLGATSTVAIVGYVIATLLMLASQAFFLRKIIAGKACDAREEKNWQGEIWRFSWPTGIFGIFTWMQLASDRWALQMFSSMHDVGNYVVLYQLGFYPISLVTGMAMQFLLPILYQRAGDASDSKRNASVNDLSWRLTWLTIGLTGLAFFAAILLHTLVFQVLVAKEYGSVSYFLPWMILAGGVFAAGQTLASNLQAQMKTREMIAAKVITALFGLILNFAGAYWYGITGIVCAGVLFSILYFLWMVVLVNKRSEKECFC